MNMGSYSCCLSEGKVSRQIQALSGTLKVVSETSRLKILCILRSGEHCVCEMMNHVDFSQSLISHHLCDLKDAGVVTDRKRGIRVYYSLTDEGRRITNLLFSIASKEVNL